MSLLPVGLAREIHVQSLPVGWRVGRIGGQIDDFLLPFDGRGEIAGLGICGRQHGQGASVVPVRQLTRAGGGRNRELPITVTGVVVCCSNPS